MRIFVFIGLVLLLIGGWCLGWFYVSGKVEEAIATTKLKLSDNGQSLDCTGQNINGFPFRISLNCENLSYANPETQVSLSTGAFKSAAQAYQPNKLVAEIQSPARLTLPGNDNFQTTWDLMRSSLSVGLSGPNRFSLQGSSLKIIPEQQSRAVVNIKEMQVHGRRNGDEAVDFALSIDDATTEQKSWPDYDLNLDMRVDQIYSDLLRRTDFLEIARSRGIEGELYDLTYTALNGGKAKLEGPIQIDPNGILTGKFQITVSELPKLLSALARVFPKYEQDIVKGSTALSAIAGSKKNDEFKIPLTVKNGTIIVGIFPIGKVPPLY